MFQLHALGLERLAKDALPTRTVVLRGDVAAYNHLVANNLVKSSALVVERSARGLTVTTLPWTQRTDIGVLFKNTKELHYAIVEGGVLQGWR